MFVKRLMGVGTYSDKALIFLDDTVLQTRKRSLCLHLCVMHPPIMWEFLRGLWWDCTASGSTASSGRSSSSSCWNTAGACPSRRLCSHLNKYLWAASVPVFLLHLRYWKKQEQKENSREIEHCQRNVEKQWNIPQTSRDNWGEWSRRLQLRAGILQMRDTI